MGLVAAKCPQCGADINVDEEKDAGICEYCGTAFITEKAINNYNTYVTNNYAGANINITGGNIENLLKMAQNAEDAGNTKEANRYFSKVLELDSDNATALLGKGITALKISSMDNLKSTELLEYAKKALEACSDKIFLIKEMGDLSALVEDAFDACVSVYNRNWKYEDSLQYLYEELTKIISISFFIITELEKRNLVDDTDLQEYYIRAIKVIINCCCQICQKRKYVKSVTAGVFGESENMANIQLNPQIHKNHVELYDDMCKAIREKDPNWTIPEIERNSEPKSGCYIATCVYGSYDCPEVWALRRFRDYTLDSTWYGRLFIKCYYAVSPLLVKWFGNQKWFRIFWRNNLDRMIMKLKENGIKDTFYQDKY